MTHAPRLPRFIPGQPPIKKGKKSLSPQAPDSSPEFSETKENPFYATNASLFLTRASLAVLPRLLKKGG